jgi:response regulator RpfG family c-di-GMP phosphodiesterase
MTHQTPVATRIARVFASLTGDAPRRVLIIDDEEALRSAMSKFLRARGYDVVVSDSGPRGLALLQAERFDALLCDVRMPGMSGIDVVPRALELKPDLAILMLTAVNDPSSVTEALAHGAMDYLMKPVEFTDLANAVERALSKRNLEIQQRNIERLIREEVALRTEELQREQRALAGVSVTVVRALVTVQEAKDVFRSGHSQRVAAIAVDVATAMRLAEGVVEDVRLAGHLHDVGKIGVPEGLISKPSRLTAEEQAQVREHVRIGVEILSPLASLARILPAVQDHHERWDGGGYPRQLSGEQISLGGRIVAAADAFDALTSRRAYREPMPADRSIEVLAADAGAQLDPAVFDALRQVVLRRKSLSAIDETP